MFTSKAPIGTKKAKVVGRFCETPISIEPASDTDALQSPHVLMVIVRLQREQRRLVQALIYLLDLRCLLFQACDEGLNFLLLLCRSRFQFFDLLVLLIPAQPPRR